MRTRAVAVRAVAVALAVAAAAWVLPRFGAVFVGGGSMAPALARGDLVVVRRDVSGVRTGDIVWVEKTGWPAGVLHRVDTVYADGSMHLRGDANPQADREPVVPARMRGVVVVVLPVSRVRAFVQRLVARWYNPASQTNNEGVDGEARARVRAAPAERDPIRLEGSRGWRAVPRFPPRAASLKGPHGSA
jgi:signal peptidase I